MKNFQTGILSPETDKARFLTFSINNEKNLLDRLSVLVDLVNGKQIIAGLGASLVSALGKDVTGLHTFPAASVKGIDIPSTPSALWIWLRGEDRGKLFHQSRLIEAALYPAFALEEVIDCMQYDKNRDLSGYEDGTENPQGEDAFEAAIVQQQGDGIDGSSFVAVQQWIHDFDIFDGLSTTDQDETIGRRRSDNEELKEAPESAHVKRTAQEDFSPQAFIVRRSMPWVNGIEGGLNFVAFGKSFVAFEALLNRMTGREDGIQDALFSFTRPVTGSYYWCPPMKNGKLDLSVVMD